MHFFDYPGETQNSSNSQLKVLENLTDSDWEVLVSFSQKTHFKKDDMLFHEGDSDDGVYILVSGRVEVVGKGSFGIKRSLAEINEGSVFGELSFFDRQARGASIRAITDGLALHLTHVGFDRLSALNPALAMQLLLDLGRVLTYRFRKIAISHE